MRQDTRRAEGADRIVDAWLRRSLAVRYEPALEEALPPAMLALLERLD